MGLRQENLNRIERELAACSESVHAWWDVCSALGWTVHLVIRTQTAGTACRSGVWNVSLFFCAHQLWLKQKYSIVNVAPSFAVCVYVNKHGNSGPHLDKKKVQQLPDHFGPGPVNVVLQQAVQACVDCAYQSKTVFGFLKSGHHGGEMITGTWRCVISVSSQQGKELQGGRIIFVTRKHSQEYILGNSVIKRALVECNLSQRGPRMFWTILKLEFSSREVKFHVHSAVRFL